MGKTDRHLPARCIITLWLAMICMPIMAQTMVWSMPPADCSSIERWDANLYKIGKNGLFGLAKPDGSIVVPIENDEITPYHQGLALVIRNMGEKRCISGILDNKGRYTPIGNTYFTIEDQEFFSDNAITVTDESGNMGYISQHGTPIAGFNGTYTDIKPFTEGYAVVKEQGKFRLIDKKGRAANIVFKSVVSVKGITNVYNGIAYIMDQSNKWHEYDVNSGQTSKTKQPSAVFESGKLDYTYCLDALTHRGTSVKHDAMQQPISSIPPLSENGHYGYAINGKEIMPCQFDNASAITDGFAVVELNGKKGIMQYVPGNGDFCITPAKPQFTCIQGKSIDVSFDLTVPSVWNINDISLTMKDEATGESLVLRKGSEAANTYTFNIKPINQTHRYEATVEANGLLLCNIQQQFDFNITKPASPKLTFELRFDKDRANVDDKIPVTAIITNPSEETITTTVRLTGTEGFAEHNEKVTIQPHEKKSIKSYFKLTVKKEKASFRISTDKYGTKTSPTKTLYPCS